MSKKTRMKKTKGDSKAKRFHTLQNKVHRLEKVLTKNPNDIAADIALSQAKYNLTQVYNNGF